MKKLARILTCITLMLTGYCSYGQSTGTLPLKPLLSETAKQFLNSDDENISIASANRNDTLIKKVEDVEKISSPKKAPAKSVEINDAETWGEWQVLGIGDMTSQNDAYADLNEEITVYQRHSTVTGHEKIFQLKIPGILDGHDAILWGEENDRQPSVSLQNEFIDYDHTYAGYNMASIGCMGITYRKALGKIYIERIWHFVSTSHSMGIPIYVNYSIQLRNMPKYSMILGSGATILDYYPASVSQANINITRTDNVAEIRYKITATGYPNPDFLPYAQNIDYDNDNSVIVLGNDASSITVDVEGRQMYIIQYMYYTADGIAISTGTQYYWSMHDDGKQWQSLGTAKYADKMLQWHCVSGNYLNRLWWFQEEEYANLELVEWNVELQQCVEEPTLYRFVNPYVNCPLIGQQVNMTSYEVDDNGKYIESVFYTYNPEYDNSQNYYFYFYSDNELKKGDGTTYAPRGALSGIKYFTGNTDKLSNYQLPSNIRLTEDNFIGSAEYGFYAKLPGYIDYKFTADYDKENDIVTVTANDAENSKIRYQFKTANDSYASEEKELPTNSKIDFKDEGLTIGVAYTLTIVNYDSDGGQQITTSISFTYGYSEWEEWNIATCSTGWGNQYANTYTHYEKSNPNHVQYKIEMGYGSLLIDAADVTNLFDGRRTAVTVPAVETYNDYWVTDAYTYTSNEALKNASYYDAIIGKFTIYAFYCIDGLAAVTSYDTYKIDGYPNLVVTLGDKTVSDGKYVQEVKVKLENCAYAKYGFFNSNGYDENEILKDLKADDNAPRITESTTLKYSDVGKFYFVAVAYDDNGNDIIDESISFKLNIPVDFSEWTPIGKSSVTDGWVIGGAFGETPSDFVQEVDTYVRNDNNDIIGLYAMYNNDFYVNNLFGQTKGDDTMIVIDASARNFIMIAPQNTGCATYNISVANYEGYQYSIGNSKDDIIANRADDIKTTYNEETNMITIPKSIFLFDGWATDGTTSYIVLPEGYKISGVRDININKDVAPEYYNLNGVRINSENLVPGLYIRRQGSKVSKVVIK